LGDQKIQNQWTLEEAFREFTPKDLQAKRNDAWTAWRDAGSPARFARFSTYIRGAEAAAGNSAQQHGHRLYLARKASSWQLWEALQKELVEGRLQAGGCPGSPNANPIAISAAAWRQAHVVSWKYSTIGMPGEPSLFFNVRISLPPETAADRQCIARADAETACREWLIEQMNDSPKLRPKPKEQYLREALSAFEGLSIRSFGRAWNDAISATGSHWNRAGAPKKSPQAKSKRQ
jgi:hypothetical protein